MSKNPFELLGMIREKNPFRNLTAIEKKENQKKEKEAKEQLQTMAVICGDLLGDQRYKQFADIFRDIEKQLVDLMINCDEPNRDRFCLKIKEYQMKLRTFKQILKVPHEFIAKAEEVARTEAK